VSFFLYLSNGITDKTSGMRCEFLPPYSPDYNPIELLFSAMKYRLRRNGDYIRFAMNELSEVEIHSTLVEAVCDITQQDTFGWFRHCGYV
jgi:transposase